MAGTYAIRTCARCNQNAEIIGRELCAACYHHLIDCDPAGLFDYPRTTRSLAEVVEECQTLAGSASPEQIATRLGYRNKRDGAKWTLHRVLRRAGRIDVWDRINGKRAA